MEFEAEDIQTQLCLMALQEEPCVLVAVDVTAKLRVENSLLHVEIKQYPEDETHLDVISFCFVAYWVGISKRMPVGWFLSG